MRRHPLSHLLARVVLDGLRPPLDSRIEASRTPFAQHDIVHPHDGSRRWTATHYGVFIPLLPEPFRYLNTMTFIGATGTEAFDNDYLVADDPKRSATVFSSTAAGDTHHYRGYDTRSECDFTDHRLTWGDDLELRVDLPRVEVAGDYENFSVRLTLDVTDHASYFVKTPVYDHVSLLAPYRGVIEYDGPTTEFTGLGTFEYARFRTPQTLWQHPLPDRLKLPVDLFTYQIIDFGDSQILLTDVAARGRTACRLAHVRTVDGPARVYEDVSYEVIDYAPTPLIDPIGRSMRVPQRSRWLVRDEAGTEILAVDCVNDAPYRYGHGRGYATAFSYHGAYQGDDVDGSGYMEWVDTRVAGEH